MIKLYIDADFRASAKGEILPIRIRAGYYGEWIDVKNPRNDGIKPSLIAGGIGVRYTCDIEYYGESRTIYVYRDKDKWFIESDETAEVSEIIASYE